MHPRKEALLAMPPSLEAGCPLAAVWSPQVWPQLFQLETAGASKMKKLKTAMMIVGSAVAVLWMVTYATVSEAVKMAWERAKRIAE